VNQEAARLLAPYRVRMVEAEVDVRSALSVAM
jgi:hypothetical protein